MSAYEELVGRTARAVRRDKFTRLRIGSAFDPSINPTESELDDARAALAEVLRTLETEAREIEDGMVRDGLEEWLHASPLEPPK